MKPVTWHGEHLMLLPERALYLPDHSTLLAADIHAGKSAHFRKHGIDIPTSAHSGDFYRLVSLLEKLQPTRMIILGDFIHSGINDQVKEWADLPLQFPKTSFQLIPGNHDPKENLEKTLPLFQISEELIRVSGLFLSHEPVEERPLIHGHIHPAIRVNGSARQSLRLPCFVVGNEVLILPAFSNFTGAYTIHPEKTDQLWICYGNQLFNPAIQ